MSTTEKANQKEKNPKSELNQKSSNRKAPEENKNILSENNVSETLDTNEYNVFESIEDAEFNNWLSVSLALEVFLKFLGPLAKNIVIKEYKDFQKIEDEVREKEDPETNVTEEALNNYLKNHKIDNVEIPNLENIVDVVKENKLALARFLTTQNNYKPSVENDQSFTETFLVFKYFRIVKSLDNVIGVSSCEFEKLLKLRAQILCTNKQRISDKQSDLCFYVLAKILDSFEKSNKLSRNDKKSFKTCKENITYARENLIKLDWMTTTEETEQKENGAKEEKLNKLNEKIENLEKMTAKFKRLFNKAYQFESTQQ